MTEQETTAPPGGGDFAILTGNLRRRMMLASREIQSIYVQGKSAVQDPSKAPRFRAMYSDLDKYYEEFRAMWNQISDLYDLHKAGLFPPKEDETLFDNTRKYFYETRVFSDSVFSTPIRERSTKSETVASTTASHLPKLSIPNFNGDLKQWPRFRDCFLSIVHADQSIPKITKFHYLTSALSGPAAAAISHLPIAAENFPIAWEALLEMYDKKRMLATSYINSMLECSPLSGKVTREALDSFVTKMTENVSALKLLEVPDLEEFLLFFLTFRKLDPSLREQFEMQYPHGDEFSTFDQLASFLRKRTLALHMSDLKSIDLKPCSSKAGSASRPSARSTLLVESSSAPANSTISCFVCKQSHRLMDCPVIREADQLQRKDLLKGFPGCFNCLALGHISRFCKSKYRCKQCNGRHHTLFHRDFQSPASISASDPAKVTLCTLEPSSTQVLLGTAIAQFKNSKDQLVQARLVIDSGSQFSLMTKRLQEALGLRLFPTTSTIQGIGQTSLNKVRGSAECELVGKTSRVILSCQALVVESITSDLPNFPLVESEIQPYLGLSLADPTFWKASEIDFLLGADLFPRVITGGPILMKDNAPWLLPSVFGHVVIGQISVPPPKPDDHLVFSSFTERESEIEVAKSLTKFWELEELSTPNRAPENDLTERNFIETHYRTDDGRYVVRLPWKTQPPVFDDSRMIALKRLRSVENKLIKNPPFRDKYIQFMRDYQGLGHMVPAKHRSLNFLPHHGIVRNEKIRVVFDASVKTAAGSLNSYLSTGPKLQKEIRDLLMNFRVHKIVLIADIVKMYRQILLHPLDRPYHHIVWREDPKDVVRTFELCTLTYGTSCAPYLAQRVLQQLVIDEGAPFPLASKAISHDMFMDDLVTGCETIEEALELRRQLVAIMRLGGFELDKWSSNSPQLVPEMDQDSSSPHEWDSKISESLKILGIQWDRKTDSLSYKILIQPASETKRGMLSFVAKLFDPLGLLAPVLVIAKGLIQDLWKAGIEWDEEAPTAIKRTFQALRNELPKLEEIHLPRRILPNRAKCIQIIGFADASQKAYSATIYLRTTTDDHNAHVQLMTARTRLAPLKSISIPRLELCGALLLARTYATLDDFIKRTECVNLPPVFFSDSQIVLHWLKTPSYRLKTFVSNRVAEILDLTPPESWKHVKSSENPSDLSSRGALPSILLDHQLWWNGPLWLSKPSSEWQFSPLTAPEELPEIKDPERSALLTVPDPNELLAWMTRFSSFSTLVRVAAWILRFGQNCRSSGTKSQGIISTAEFQEAKIRCILAVQSCLFPDPTGTSLAPLKPFVDSRGVLRVGGRLSNSDLPYASQHPILLPKKCHFTNLLLDHLHKLYLHPGPSLLQALVQRKYWVVGLRRLVRQRTFNCNQCYRDRAATRTLSPIMADLPPDRVNASRPFCHSGVDFAGPFAMKTSKLRKAPQSKTYLALFICMSTKALHLEAVTELSTEAFLASFSRFASRRGCPSTMRSDCGTNFQGAARHLRDCYSWLSKEATRNDLIRFGHTQGLTWTFNPPHGAHFGGLWEAGVKSVKSVLRKVVGETSLTYEEWATVFAKVEAILNSRPLCPISTSPNETDFLSPAHFLIGTSLASPPEQPLDDTPINTLSRWQLVTKLTRDMWRRWSLEYLGTLQARGKWTKHQRNIKIGDTVLLKESTSPMRWPVGRVVEVHPGRDGVVRVVTLQVGSNTYLRPVVRLVPFPYPDPDA